jgi:hypothetical protein
MNKKNNDKKLKNNNILKDIDNKMKEIDPNYNPACLKDIEFDENKDYKISDLINIIDEKLKKINK